MIAINFLKPLKCQELNGLVLKKELKLKFFLLKDISRSQLLEYYWYKKWSALLPAATCRIQRKYWQKKSARPKVRLLQRIMSSKRNRRKTALEQTAEFNSTNQHRIFFMTFKKNFFLLECVSVKKPLLKKEK